MILYCKIIPKLIYFSDQNGIDQYLMLRIHTSAYHSPLLEIGLTKFNIENT